MIRSCEGCLAYDSIKDECNEGFPNPDKCPCRECLVKVMCLVACAVFLDTDPPEGDPNE